jgi:hypothetical protein|tara:strand:+ start:731 stop:1324 length:594 start_codon:yes stop_codon:yes gene_type:complete
MPQDKKYGITNKQADEWLKKNPINTKHGGYIKRDDVREMMKNSQSMKPITVTPQDKQNLLPLDLQKNFNKERIALHQTALKNAGFYKGDIDSIWGPKSQQAYNQYQADPQARMRGAGAFGKDATGNPRTPFRDAMNFIKKKSGKIEDIFIDKMGDVGAMDEEYIQLEADKIDAADRKRERDNRKIEKDLRTLNRGYK